MATIEKLIKAFEALKVFQPAGVVSDDILKKKDQTPSKKEKMTNCHVITDCICAHNMRSIADFPKFLGIAIEAFLGLCDDSEADTRMVADECLNRTIKTLLETNLGRLQVELYKEMKKNGASRSLRAALWRFADMAHLIRPQKCRPYIVNLTPCLARICHRQEEAIQETLTSAMQKICPALMAFATDKEVKLLLKSFVPNLNSPSATCRRTAANSLSLICQHSRSPVSFYRYLLGILLQLVLPVEAEHSVCQLLGVILCFRHMIPHISNPDTKDEGLKGSFGVNQKDSQQGITTELLLQLYQLLLHFTGHADHNVITASLEALQQLLRLPPPCLLPYLTQPDMILKSMIFQSDLDEESRSRKSSSTGLPSISEDTGFDLEQDVSETGIIQQPSRVTDERNELPDLEELNIDEQSNSNKNGNIDGSPDISDNPDICVNIASPDAEYTNMEIGDLNDEKSERSLMSHSDSAETLHSIKSLSPRRYPLQQGAVQDVNGNIEYDETIQVEVPELPSETLSQSEAIGTMTDGEVSVTYCVRLLCNRFLLSGTPGEFIPDGTVRVSVKSLSLGCVAYAVALCPEIILHKLFVDERSDNQQICDILKYTSHSDPQLKGTTALIIGNLLHSILVEGKGKCTKWLKIFEPESIPDVISLENLVDILVTILEDESSIATRLTLSAFQICLEDLLHSSHGQVALNVLLSLMDLKWKPYWLVKVELLEVIGNIDFRVVSYLESCCLTVQKGSHHYLGHLHLQHHFLHDVIFVLLSDEDKRVRHCAATTIVKLIPKLFFATDSPQQDSVIALAKHHADKHLHPSVHEWCLDPPPLIQGLVKSFHFHPEDIPHASIESSLSRVVMALLELLHESTSKHLTSGCCHSLSLLSEAYQVSMYPHAYGCGPANTLLPKDSSNRLNLKRQHSRSLSTSSAISIDDLISGSGGGPLPIILSLLTSSPVALDLASHRDTLQLAGNLLAGAAYKCLKPGELMIEISGPGSDGKWAAVSDRLLVPEIEKLLTHVARLLNACSHIIDEQTPGPPIVKPTLPSLPNAPSLSPIKRKAKGEKDASVKDGTQSQHQSGDTKSSKQSHKDKEKESDKEKNKKEGLGSFHTLPHYMRLYETLKGAFSNYKLTLDLNASDKFCNILRIALEVLSQILEIANLFDIGKYAEEFLGYLKSTVVMEPTTSIFCVQQLLKALFGTNIANQWEPSFNSNLNRKSSKSPRMSGNNRPGLYHYCFTQPYTQFTQSIVGFSYRANQSDQDDNTSMLTCLKKRIERKTPSILKPGSKVDKTAIASYIRMFEPLVIKALKQYTLSSCPELQRQVLNLLSQLIQLRVNYCLLDSDQIFIGFVLKQFEFIEEGQIRNSELLMPHVFQFLVLLSYEKYHSKTIIGMPKIIQLCDGIMASGLQPVTHAIPALQQMVYDLFLLRGNNKGDISKELETQREVVVSMLLRLLQYYQALDMFVIVLQQCHRESEERWKRLSRQVTDIVLPALAKQQINIESHEALDVLHRLFESVAPSVFRPVDILLKTLLTAPKDVSTVQGLQRWLCLVLAVLRVIIAQSKEEVVLSRLQELSLHTNIFKLGNISQENKDIAQSLGPEETMAWFILCIVGNTANLLSQQSVMVSGKDPGCEFLTQQLSHLLLYITHMFQSGLFRRIATATMKLIHQDTPSCFYNITEINHYFLSLSSSHSTVTLQWSNVLILLNYDHQKYWAEVLKSSRKYRTPTSGKMDENGKKDLRPLSCSVEILRRGGLILFCDYVVTMCENLTDAEQMTWLIINYVGDLIELSHESPVQDLISAIHRNPAASSLFIQAIHARCENVIRPYVVRKTLKCLESIHMSQSGALLTLLIDKFLNTHQLTVGRLCDTIACRRMEFLLSESHEECSKQLPLEDLDKLLEVMKTHGLVRRHPRLTSLLTKYRNILCPENVLSMSPEKSHPLAALPSVVFDIQLNKEFFISVVKDLCFRPDPNARECGLLLQKLDYADILTIAMTKDFNLAIIQECLSLGALRTLLKFHTQSGNPQPDSAQFSEPSFDRLFRAMELTLFRHLNNTINMLPVPHQVFSFSTDCSSKALQYLERLEDYLTDSSWTDSIFHLSGALLQYLVSSKTFPWESNIPSDSQNDVCRFTVLCLEIVTWLLHQDQLPTSEQLQTTLECTSQVLQNQQLFNLIGTVDHSTWMCSVCDSVYQIISSLIVLPGENIALLQKKTKQENHEIYYPSTGDEHIKKACSRINDLIGCLSTRLCPRHAKSQLLPKFLAAPMRNIIVCLSRLPLLNSYARTPSLVWKMGWSPSPRPDSQWQLSTLPLDFLQDKEVLKDFVFRNNSLGWTSRQQFEETWMSLLGVLNPAVTDDHQLSHEEDIERTQAMVVAVKAITSMLVQVTLSPCPGNPTNSKFETRPRDKKIAFLHTRCGRKLSLIRGIIEQEIRSLCAIRPDRIPHHSYAIKCGVADPIIEYLFDSNLERELGEEDFLMAQVSLESIWEVIGHTHVSTSDSDTTDSMDSPDRVIKQNTDIPMSSLSQKERPIVISGIDVNSCLQFLLEMYGQWVSPNANPKTPLMLLNATVKSIVCLSDLFVEKEQFEWMLDTLMDIYKTHPSEDELISQYVTVGLCKAVSVLETDSSTIEKVIKIVDAGFRSPHLSSKIATLNGTLYLLESGISDITRQVVPMVTDFLLKNLSALSGTVITTQHYILIMWAAAFYVMENYHDELKDVEFPSKILQLAVNTASGNEDCVSMSIYLAVMKGLERLLLADVLSKHDAESIIKLSVDRLCLPSPQRSLAALGLMLTCMYSGKQFDQYSPRPRDTEIQFKEVFDSDVMFQDPESLIQAMERITVLFDRIKKGFPFEARVITRIMPAFLTDFFPPQDIMNKIIGEFISNQQPYPQLIAKVVFQVFFSLQQKNQQTLVRDWVMLSLSNFTQRTPVSMATWSLTCFFTSASTNNWLKSLFSHVIGRMGKNDDIDRKLFCLAGIDFYSQLTDEAHKRAFQSTFHIVAQPDTPYKELLNCL